MVLKKKKKVDNGSIGFQVSIIPRAPRSTRRWALGRKTADEHVCAMELLASIAGKLLQETESSASNHGSEEDNQQAHFNQVFVKRTLSKDRPPKVEEQGSCEGSVVSGEESQQKNSFRTPPEVESDNHWECSSTFVDSPRPYLKKESRDVIITSEISNKVESLKSEIYDSEIKLSVDHQEVGGIAMLKNSFCLEQSAERSAVLAAVPSPNFQRQKLFSTWQKRDTKSGGRDEKVSTFSKSSTKYKSLRHPRRALDSKVRKLLASKHWKVSPQLKNCECLEDDVARNSLNQKRRISYKHERYHRDFICKRRKLLDGGLVMTSFLNSKITTNSDNKEKIYTLDDSFKNTHGEMGKSSSVFGSQASFHPKNAHVKFSIKSFKVPELLIDVPETATVGSLKRTIVEAVTAILGGGLHVGVLLNGKKVGDDNRTLQQSGISCEENLNSLGFMLEPNLIQLIPASEHSALLESASTPEPLTSSIRCNTADTMVASDSSPSHNPSSNVCKKYEQQEVSPVHASSDSGEVSVTEKPTFESQALVCVAADTSYHLPLPLAIIPFTQKSKRLELSQRRIRRPFSVSEVEALVEAVEQLGNGRWRDVKLRAFENANHRTYVDLKDKWKTLVHTASISVQQRRGEPVPQELLDRVMAAHSYWSHHQSKQQQQQGKQLQPAETLRIADVPENE